MPQENIPLESHEKEQTHRVNLSADVQKRGKADFQLLGVRGGGVKGATHVQVLQTVPTEGVFAALAQHLRAALVPLDVDAAHRTLLDGQIGIAAGASPAERAELGGEVGS